MNLRHIQRARAIAFWATPPLIALALYWPGLTAWFQKDDFAWLGLRDMVTTWRDLWWALFVPLAQGTIRTLSERVFYMSFYSLFGMNALPYRCWAFLTHAATLTMLSAVCTKLTGSRAAGFWAAILWTVNGALAVALSWTAIYYELLCSFFLLLDFWLLLRYVETGERRYYLAQWVTFALGFGVLELNVVYPALAAVYAVCCAPSVIKKVLPMFALSAAYSVIHMLAAPLQPGGPYKMYWDSSVISTLWTYWKMALGPNRLILVGIYPSLYRSALTAVLMIGLLGFLGWKLCRRQWVAAFFPAWFLIVLAPMLPLRDHVSEYYLTIPLIGLAMWSGWALVCGWRAGTTGRIAALSSLVIYLCVSVPVARVTTMSFYERSQEIRKLVLGVVSLSRSHPGKVVLLTGVSPEMFWSAIFHRPFRMYGINEVYLTPDSEPLIAAGRQIGEAQKLFIDPAAERKALDQDRALVFDMAGGVARDVTAEYRRSH